MRAHALPADMLVVIRIAAGCSQTSRAAARATGVRSNALKDACAFYLQQILFTPDADCYRVLGVAPHASRKEMREHLRWLLKWLHPDANREEWESVFAERVLKAWRMAGGKDRDRSRSEDDIETTNGPAVFGRPAFPVQRWVALPLREPSAASPANRRRLIAAAVLISVLGIAVALAPFARSLLTE